MTSKRLTDKMKPTFIIQYFFRQKILPFCHIWYNSSAIPIVSPVTSLQTVGPTHGGLGKGDIVFPHLLGCYPQDSVKHLVPVAVSLVETKCPGSKASNNLRVHFDRHKSGKKQGFAVCSKSLSHLEDMSIREGSKEKLVCNGDRYLS